MITVRVYGEDRAAAAFGAMSRQVEYLTRAWRRIGARLRSTAVPLTPVKSGALVRSLRAQAGRDSATLSAGTGLEDYAGVQNYGWPRRNIEAQHFLNRSLVANQDTAEREVLSDVERVARRVGLT